MFWVEETATDSSTWAGRKCNPFCELDDFGRIFDGISFAFVARVGVRRLEDLSAYQLATEFKTEVYRLADSSVGLRSDERYRLQLFDASASVAANIAEGWARFSAAEFCQFLRYARASLEEAQTWLHDGVARGYFNSADAIPSLKLASRCSATIIALWRSLQPFIKKGGR